jgi:hypothetical protein
MPASIKQRLTTHHILPIIKASPGRSVGMKSKNLHRLHDTEGKGMIGCLLLIVLAGVTIYLGIVLVPIYYANFNLESGIKTEISRAGAHFLDNETVIKDVLELAKRNEILVKKENISVERFAGQVHLIVRYSVPVDFILFERDLVFQIKESSFIGTL